MRIVYLHQYFNTPQMSGGTRSYEFARRMVAAGHDVHMITSDRNGMGKPYETIEEGIRITWIPVAYSNNMGAIARTKAFLLFAMKSSLIAANSPADVVFATSTPLTIAIPGIYGKWRQDVPMVFEVRDLWPEMPIAMGVLRDPVSKWFAQWLERMAYRSSAHIVALSPGIRDGIVTAGCPADKVTVIPNACDIDRFRVDLDRGRAFRERYEWLGARKLIVYTGTLGDVNGVDYLVNVAAAMLCIDPEIRFLVLGSGKDVERVRERAEGLGVLGKSFFMFSDVCKAEVPEILNAANLCTSLFINVKEMWNNSANKFFDSLAAGRPVAINYGGWQAELILSHGCGLLLDPQDPGKAAKAIFEFVSDEALLNQAGRNAFALATTKFARDDQAAVLIGVLKSSADAQR